MLLTSISTLGLSQRLKGSMTGLQIDLARVNDELASGKRYDVAGHLGARTGQAISFRQLHERSEEYLKTTTLLDSRMTLMASAMAEMDTVASDVFALAVTGASEPSQTGAALQIKTRGALDLMVGLLNTSDGSRQLFSGVDIDTPAMRQIAGDDSGIPDPLQLVRDTISAALGGPAVPATGAESAIAIAALDAFFAVRPDGAPVPPPLTNEFEGGVFLGTKALDAGGASNPRVSGMPEDGSEVPYGIQANDPFVRDMMQGLFMLAAIDTHALPQDAYQPYMEAALAKLGGGLDGLRAASADLGVRHAAIAQVEQRHTARMKVLNEQINALEDVDPYEASVRLNQIEAQLEAAMNATARVSRLRLTDYL